VELRPPHRAENFKLSKNKRFVGKLTDVVGMYLHPPDQAVVLGGEEKSLIQDWIGRNRGCR
jgi:hypothetical protein